MILTKIKGQFANEENLLAEIIKEYLQYDYKFERLHLNSCFFTQFVIKFVKINTESVGIFVDKTSCEPKFITLNSILLENQKFPLEINQNLELKNVIEKQKLCENLISIKSFVENNLCVTAGDVGAPPEKVVVGAPPEKVVVAAPPEKVFDKQQDSAAKDGKRDALVGFQGLKGIPSASIGHGDLDPFSAGASVGGIPSGGGMIVGPDHPLFNQQGLGSPFGMGPHLPPGSVPPGARFDPIGPFGPQPGFPVRPGSFGSNFYPGSGFPNPNPNQNQNQNQNNPGYGARRRPPLSGDPDNDMFLPPGNENDF